MSAYSEFSAHSEYPVPEVVPAVAADDKIRCDACPVMCYIKPGMAGVATATPTTMACWYVSIRW